MLSVIQGNLQVEIKLPPGWELLPSRPLNKRPPLECVGVRRLTMDALLVPRGGEPLWQRVKPGRRVALVCDDATRHTPLKEMLPVILEQLESLGVARHDIDIVMGLGTHAPMTREQLEARLGGGILERYRVSQHDCHAKDLVPVGYLATGTQVCINPLVARASLSIGLGTITPHPMNGFGGGPKIVFPAIADYQAIREHHLAWTTHPGSTLGNLDDNVFYREVLRVAELARLDYALNCVFDLEDRVAAVLFGSVAEVHRRGAELSRRCCGLEFERPAQVTIVSAHPYREPLQLMKPLVAASRVTKPGGTLILLSQAIGGFPPFFKEVFQRVERESGGEIKEFARRSFEQGRLLLEDAPIDLNCALFYALACRNDYRVVVVDPGLDAASLEAVGFVPHARLDQALAEEARRLPRAEVNLMPVGSALPLLAQEAGQED